MIIKEDNGSWIPPLYIEGTWESLPEDGYAKTLPVLGNEKIIGLALLFGLFFMLVDWSPITSVILPLLSKDGWLVLCMVLLMIFRFVQLVSVRPVGARSAGGLAGPQNNELVMYEIVGELFLTVLLCLLVWFKNPLAILFVLVFLWGRLRIPVPDASQNWPEDP